MASKKTKKVETAAEARARYKNRKAVVHAMEKGNHDRLIAFETLGENGFWKMIGNSAVIYSQSVAVRMKKEVELKVDKDFYDKDKYGWVSIGDIDTLERNLKKFEIERVPYGEDLCIRIFDLGYKVSDADIKNLLKKKEILVAQINKMVLPKMSYPEIYQKLRLLVGRAYELHRKTEEPARRVTYERIVTPLFEANEAYILLARNKKKPKEALMEMYRKLEYAMAAVKIIFGMRLWDAKAVNAVCKLLVEAETLIRAEYKKLD